MYQKLTKTVSNYLSEIEPITDTQPVGQRLPVFSRNNMKSVGIIESMLSGIDLGTMTLMKVSDTEYQYESIDGGHRKRAIKSFVNNEFPLSDGRYFRNLDAETRQRFMEIELTFTVYYELPSFFKGRIFRTLNKTTDVNFIEKLNSYGDIPIANFVRETVRFVNGINNEFNSLFSFTVSPKTKEPKYEYLSFDNDRLKQDHMVARIVHRYHYHNGNLMGGSSDQELEAMYEDETIVDTKSLHKQVTEHLSFLRTMAILRKQRFKGGLTQHEFKVLSYLYMHMVDTYKSFNITDAEGLYDSFAIGNSILMEKDGVFKNEPHKSGYTLPVMYRKYIAAPWDTKKIKEAMRYLLTTMPDPIDKFIKCKDTKRGFSVLEREAKLAEQRFVCAIDKKPLRWEDAHAGHIIAHANGGTTTYDNLAMIRKEYNTEMGTMDLDDYVENVYMAS